MSSANSIPDSNDMTSAPVVPSHGKSTGFETSPSAQANLSPLSETLLSLLQDTIRYFLSRDVPVYLDQFGILFPRTRTSDRSYQRDAQLIVRKEFNRTIEFEKCSNLSKFHRDTYTGLIELKELSQRVYALLPVHRAVDYTEKDIRHEISTLISHLVQETVTRGSSTFFRALGTFYALHNRQGSRFEDWFAGSDIFLHSHFSEPTSAGQSVVRERPILESSWELLEAAYGAPLMKRSLHLARELEALGYDIAELPSDIEHQIPVAVFQAHSAREKTHYLIFCTDGLRRQGIRAKRGRGYGTEMVLQLPITAALNPDNRKDLDEIPLWPFRPLTMGWILMQSSPSRTLRAGLKMTEGVTLIPDYDSELSCIFTTEFLPAREEQLSSEGPFYYANIIGITQDEYSLAEKNGAEQLRTILEYKKLLQFTKPLRSSLTSRSSFTEKPAKKRASYVLTDPRLMSALEGSRASVPA